MGVRRASAEDAEAIARLQVANWQWDRRGLMPDALLESLSPASRVVPWQALIERTDAAVLVAEADELLGFCALVPAPDEDLRGRAVWQIEDLEVAPRWRRRYLGRVLLRRALALARVMGASELCLWLPSGNPAALRFGARHGFRADGTAGHDERVPGAALQVVRYRAPLSDL